VAAVQDINPKVTGALFLREFMSRHPEVGIGAATRVLVPEATASAEKIRSLVSKFSTAEQPCEEIAVVPGRWAMIATSGRTSMSAGAQALMVFDTWGGVLTPAQYEEFSLRYMGQVVDALTRNSEGRRVPNIVFTKGGGAWLDRIAAIGCDAAGVDWTTDLGDARKAVGGRVALQGNLDPSALFAPPPVLRAETLRVLESYGAGAGHVFNLGHGITPDVDPERVALLVKTVQEYKPT